MPLIYHELCTMKIIYCVYNENNKTIQLQKVQRDNALEPINSCA